MLYPFKWAQQEWISQKIRAAQEISTGSRVAHIMSFGGSMAATQLVKRAVTVRLPLAQNSGVIAVPPRG